MMQSSILFLISLLSVVVNAHFQLQFPAPRGVFVEDNEPNFCDGYNTAASNRTVFPLTGGFFTLNSEHPKWTSEVLLSTASNPTSFDNFSSVVPFFQLNGEGIFCIPLDFSKTNATGLKDGQNVTIQIVFDGGDDTLYQCADLTLSSNASISSVSCTNATDNSGGSSSSSASTPSSTGSPANRAVENSVPLMFASALGLVGIVSAFML